MPHKPPSHHKETLSNEHRVVKWTAFHLGGSKCDGVCAEYVPTIHSAQYMSCSSYHIR
jgi:hypothetical protein